MSNVAHQSAVKTLAAVDPPQNPPPIALICDYLEEGWVSMNFCAEMLFEYLHRENRTFPHQIRPQFQRRFGHLPGIGKKRSAFLVDRTLNCFWDYPRYLKRQVRNFDFFHLCDHSYAHLVHDLPGDRTGVFCHDIDCFRPLLEPEQYPASARYKIQQTRVLRGMQKAAVVFHTTQEVRRQIEHYNLIDPSRLVQAPLGTAPEFSAVPQSAQSPDQQIISQLGQKPFLLSVSSNKQRKRLDVLLEVFAAVRQRHPDLLLVRVGREVEGWTSAQQAQIDRLGIANAILYLRGLERTALAEVYRRAKLVLITSEAEGFGLPVVEALACGSAVVASEIPALQEVGEAAVEYCPVGDILTWTETVDRLLTQPTTDADRTSRLTQAAQYSWSAHARAIAQTYLNLS